ncbi:MAG: ADP-ribosylation factor-like protein [Promethearchaeota archaeon]
MNSEKKEPAYPFTDLSVNGCVFAMFSKMGPEPIFSYPIPNDTTINIPDRETHIYKFEDRNYFQVAVKGISLLLTDFSFETSNEHLENTQIFGVLPFPDMESLGLTYFTYYYSESQQCLIPVTLTLMVHDRERIFIYNSINYLKEDIKNFSAKLFNFCDEHKIFSEQDAQPYWAEKIPEFVKFFQKVQKIQKIPVSPLTQSRRINILFTGLEGSGKSSYILAIKRKFSGLPSLVPTTEATKDTIDFLGTTILKWDIPGKKEIREDILKQRTSDIYIFETDVLYYFIDVQNPQLEESMDFLKRILEVFEQNDRHPPIIFILTKVDEDIAELSEIKESINKIESKCSQLIKNNPYRFFLTSIFTVYSILNSFSYGIRQLSPNREILEHIIWEFLAKHDLKTGMILNANGLVIAASEIIKSLDEKILERQQIFELAAPHFTTIAQQFDKSNKNKNSYSDLVQYQFSDKDFIILKKFFVEDYELFALFYSQNPKSKKNIKNDFPKFQTRIENLLKYYIF